MMEVAKAARRSEASFMQSVDNVMKNALLTSSVL
jgi:hypothetical protein